MSRKSPAIRSSLYLRDIGRLFDRLLARKWLPLKDCKTEKGLGLRGVYVLAYSKKRLIDSRIRVADIFYVGMSNSKGGVRTRLRQFQRGIESGEEHSAAVRFFRTFGGGRPYSELRSKKPFFFAALTLPRNSNGPKDLLQKGRAVCLESYVLVRILARQGKNPVLNKL